MNEYEELPVDEKKEIELSEFLRELVTKINKRFDDQENAVEDAKRNIERLEEKIRVLESNLEEVAEREKRISRDILAIID